MYINGHNKFNQNDRAQQLQALSNKLERLKNELNFSRNPIPTLDFDPMQAWFKKTIIDKRYG